MDDYPLDLYQNNYRLFYISHVIGAQVLQDAIICHVKRADPDVKTFKEYEEKKKKKKKEEEEEKLCKDKRTVDPDVKEKKEKQDWLKEWKGESLESLWDNWEKHKPDVTGLFPLFEKDTAEFGSVEKLKNYRNRVCHAIKPIVKDETYKNELKGVKDIIMEIYNCMVPVSEDSEKDFDIKSRMKDIAEKVDQIDSVNFEQFKKDFDENLCNFFIREGRLEFSQIYNKKYKLSTPFSWMWEKKYREFDVSKIFTPLKGQNGETLDMKYILRLFSRTKIIIFCGIAGSGKTSLCRSITHEWLKSVALGLDKSDSAEEIEGIGSFDLIFHIELREFTRALEEGNIAYTCLDYLLPGSLSKSNSIYGQDHHKGIHHQDIFKALQTLNILFIIDGFDEASQKGGQIVHSLMEHFKDSKIILTTRLEYQEKVESIFEKGKYRSITICGFDKKGLEDFLEKIFTDLISDPSERDQELKEFDQMIHNNADVLDEHLKLPLTTALLVTMWHHVPNERGHLKSKTATELYDTMFGLWKKRVNNKLNDSQKRGIDEKLLKYLSKIAWNNLNDDTVYLEKKQMEDFKKECSELDISEYEVISGFLVLQGEEYHFMHKTETEFLAAGHITEKLKENFDFSEFFGVESTIKFRQLFKYLTGCMFKESLLDNHQVKELMKIIDRAGIDKTDYNYWHSLVRESHQNGALCGEIRRRLPKDEWKLYDGTVLAGVGLLTFTRPKSLRLEINDNPYEIGGFLKGWVRLPHTRHRGGQIQVELILKHSWNIAGSRDTDEFLSSLSPWGELTYYQGHLGEHCGKTLKNCYKLKHLLARISTVNALKALSKSLKHNSALQTLQITLDIPKEEVANVPPMEFKKHLDITIPSSNEEDIEWINNTVFTLGERIPCRQLTLNHCDMTEDGIRSLVRKLVEDQTVDEKLVLRLAVDLSEDTIGELEDFVNKCKKFKIAFF